MDLFDYLPKRGGETVCAILIETRSAIEHLEEICKVEGIDYMTSAPFDLSTELGVSGQLDAPELVEAVTTEGRRIAEKVISSFPSCPIPEVARLGRTLKAWRQQLLAYFDTSGVSNGGTEAINLIIEKVRLLAHGFRDFTHYRLRILLAASGNRAYRK